MPVLFDLVRKPRTRLTPNIIRDEIRKAYETQLWPYVKQEMERPLQGWAVMPEFKHKVSVSGRRYSFSVSVDRRTKMGKIYWWVDQGTGLEGPSGTTYVIEPVEAPVLRFQVPYQPSTFPPTPLRYTPGPSERWITSGHIDHPGIQARNFSEQAYNKFKDRGNVKGWYRITENAYRRGFRKARKMGIL